MKTQSRTWQAAVWGAGMGGISGALIGANFNGGAGALIGGISGALYLGAAEAITDRRRQQGHMKPYLHRVIATTILGGALGAVLSQIIGLLPTGLLMGLLFGLLGFGPRKLLLGILMGAALGLSAITWLPINGAVLGSGLVLIYRLLLFVLFRDTEPIQLAAEQVPQEEARYVVPFETHTRYVGTEYMAGLARETDGSFRRNRPGIGLLDSLDALRGPQFDPAQVDPRIRDFYEHTSQYRLEIIPEWNAFMRPFYRLFKQYIAQPIGQANLPFDIEEAQRGVVSYIDSIDYAAETSEHIRTLRGWIRAFETTGEPIYVGIYTVVEHDGIGYISVGFPLPESNFTATLLPYNRGRNLLLRTQGTGRSFPGHYVSYIDNDTGALTILKLPTFGEEIDVFIHNEQLKTDHHFYLGGFRFLTLHYHIQPKPVA